MSEAPLSGIVKFGAGIEVIKLTIGDQSLVPPVFEAETRA